MTEKIFLIKNDGSLNEMEEHEFQTEDIFQELLEKYPQLMSGEQINQLNPRKWFLVSREMGIPATKVSSSRWSVDHLFLDQDGIPTLVEVKRSSDTRIRREVVGQMMEYAANAVLYWSIEDLIKNFELNCEKSGVDPEILLKEEINAEIEYNDYWELVKSNLNQGKVRLIFLADSIPSELKRIIEFLNEQMSPAEVLGVELKQFANNGTRTIVPKVFGLTSNAIKVKASSRSKRQWDEESFFENLSSRRDDKVVNITRELFKWAQSKCDKIWFGAGQENGSFVPTIFYSKIKHQPFCVWSSGHVEIYFYWYAFKQPFDKIEKRKELMEKLNEIDGVNFTEFELEKRPSIDLSLLASNDGLNKFISTFDWYLSEVKRLT